MNKRTILESIIILSIMIISSSTTIVYGQTITPGVAKGDVYTYNYNVTWNSTDPNLSMPEVIADLAKIQSFRIEITSVSGAVVDGQVTTTFRDGSSQTETGFVDVRSGAIQMPHGNLIIAGNLNTNDKIYPTGGDMTLNNTVARTYATGSRPTSQSIVETNSENHYSKTDVYYDKTKGIAVSSYYVSIDTFGAETETFTETITNTNADAWAVAIPEFPTAIMPLLLLAAVPAILIGLKKQKMKKLSAFAKI